MHPSILAKRKAQALNRIMTAAQALDPEHAEALEPKGIKDPAAVEMMRLEALADLMERLAPGESAAVSVETEPETEPAGDGRPTIEDFPAHVVESPAEPVVEPPAEPEPETKPARKTTKRVKKSP